MVSTTHTLFQWVALLTAHTARTAPAPAAIKRLSDEAVSRSKRCASAESQYASDDEAAPDNADDAEEWRECARFPRYAVSRPNLVRNIRTGAILIASKGSVTLTKIGGGRESVRVAALVAEAFGDRPPAPRPRGFRSPAPVERKIGDTDTYTRFSSISEASRKTGTSQAAISSACHGRQSLAGGFVWRFCTDAAAAEDDDVPVERVFEGGAVDQFISMHEAERITGTPISAIGQMCNGQSDQPDYCTWRFAVREQAVEAADYDGSNSEAPEPPSDSESESDSAAETESDTYVAPKDDDNDGSHLVLDDYCVAPPAPDTAPKRVFVDDDDDDLNISAIYRRAYERAVSDMGIGAAEWRAAAGVSVFPAYEVSSHGRARSPTTLELVPLRPDGCMVLKDQYGDEHPVQRYAAEAIFRRAVAHCAAEQPEPTIQQDADEPSEHAAPVADTPDPVVEPARRRASAARRTRRRRDDVRDCYHLLPTRVGYALVRASAGPR